MSSNLVPTFCGKDCGGDACPLLAEVEDGVLRRIRVNPASAGRPFPCAKGFALGDVHYSANRIKRPLKRVGSRGSGDFREIGWDEAFSTIHDRLGDIIGEYGPTSVISLASAGSTGLVHSTEVLTARFLDTLGGHTSLFGSYSNGAASASLRKVFGGDYGRSGFDPGCLADASMIVLWGANVMEARLGAEVEAQIAAAARRGARIVCLDPRRTKTSSFPGIEWIPILPGTDAALMYALLFVFNSEGTLYREKAKSLAEGYDELLGYVCGDTDGIVKDPHWAAPICGVPEERIRSLALEWAAAPSVLLFPGYSIQRTESGEEVMRLCVALQVATGNFGRPGGSTGSINNRMPGPGIRLPRSLPPASPSPQRASVPLLRWADAILEGSGQAYPSRIRALYSAGGNFLNQGADIAKNVRAFESVDFSVCHELFLTPTATYCDIVLPAASPLEKEDVGIPWAGNYLLYKPACLPAMGHSRTDFDIFDELADRFGRRAAFSGGMDAHEWVAVSIEESEIADDREFLASGIYFGAGRKRRGLAAFARDPGRCPLATKSGKVELSGARWSFGPGQSDEVSEFPLSLITPKRSDRVHSQGGHLGEAVYANFLEIHPSDARLRLLAEGDIARVRSSHGDTRARIHLSDSLKEGVVCLFEGSWWRSGVPGDSKGACPGAANSLTSTQGTRESTSCVMHAIRVQVDKVL